LICEYRSRFLILEETSLWADCVEKLVGFGLSKWSIALI
jgi:hypothetical protein